MDWLRSKFKNKHTKHMDWSKVSDKDVIEFLDSQGIKYGKKKY